MIEVPHQNRTGLTSTTSTTNQVRPYLNSIDRTSNISKKLRLPVLIPLITLSHRPKEDLNHSTIIFIGQSLFLFSSLTRTLCVFLSKGYYSKVMRLLRPGLIHRGEVRQKTSSNSTLKQRTSPFSELRRTQTLFIPSSLKLNFHRTTENKESQHLLQEWTCSQRPTRNLVSFVRQTET